MPKNEVTMFQAGAVPAHIAKFNEEQSNIRATSNGDTLSYKGKVWTVSQNGAKQILMKTDENGDEQPRPMIPVIILGYADHRGRSYYDGGYDGAAAKAPVCWSKNGFKPDDDVPEKQSVKCATCPMAAKGSRVADNGKETKACQEFLYVAVQLYRKWEVPPLRMRLAITSIYDAKNPAQEAKNYFAFQQYCNMLKANGVRHTASVVTRLKFDPAAEYPKVLFSNTAWLPEDELDMVSDLAHSDLVKELLNPVFDGAPADEGKAKTPAEDDEEDGPKTKPAAKTAGQKAGALTKTDGTKADRAAANAKVARAKQPDPEPEDDEDDALEGDVVEEGGETATDVTDLVDGAEDEDEEAAIAAAEAAAQALRDRKAAKAAGGVKTAAATAKAVKAAAPAEDDEGDDDGDGKVVVTPPKAPAKAAAATTGKVQPSAGKVTVGKTQAAPKGTPAAAPSKVSASTAEIISEW